MKQTFILVGLFLIQTLSAQNNPGDKPSMLYPFQTAFFIKNTDSLKQERAAIEKLLIFNAQLFDSAKAMEVRQAATLKWYDNNLQLPEAERIDSLNRLMKQMNQEVARVNRLDSILVERQKLFSSLFSRVTERFTAFEKIESTKTKQITLDWKTYMQMARDFYNWEVTMAENWKTQEDERNQMLAHMNEQTRSR